MTFQMYIRKIKTDSTHEVCNGCSTNWNPSRGSDNCPVCELKGKIDRHIESILLQDLTSQHSKYIFEIDDKTAAMNRLDGFSFRINRKHNLIHVREIENISIKNTYLLMSSHIEAAFNDIQKAYQLTCGDVPSGVTEKKSLYKLFSKAGSQRNFNETIFKNVRYLKIINAIRLVVNIIKHNNSVVMEGTPLGKTIKIKKNIDVMDLWRKKLPDFHREWLFGNTTEIICIVRAFLFDLCGHLFSSPKVFKPNKIDILDTIGLLKLHLRPNIGEEILKDCHREGLVVFPSAFVKSANNKSIFHFIKEKTKILKKIYRINPDYVVALETGLGGTPKNNAKLEIYVLMVNGLVTGLRHKRRKIKGKPNEFWKIYTKVLKKLAIKYGEHDASSLGWNEFHNIKRKQLSNMIIDFYKIVCSLNERNAGILMRGVGECPFRRWNPFAFDNNFLPYS